MVESNGFFDTATPVRDDESPPVATWVRFLGITAEGRVRVTYGREDGTQHTVGMLPDQVAGPHAFEEASGYVLDHDAFRAFQEEVTAEVPPRLFRRFTADDLTQQRFEDVQYVIPGILPEGLAVFAGKPKVGKSWWAIAQAVDVASTGADVLYLALEDNPRRLQNRLRSVLRGRPAPRTLTFETAWDRLDDGGLDRLTDWLDGHKNARLVVVDTVAKVRPHRGANEDQYLGDYRVWGPLQSITLTRPGLAILGVHHQRKGAAEDVLDTVLGSQGVTGSVDTVIILKKARSQADGELYVVGRDLRDEADLALRFQDGVWTLLGDAADFRASNEQSELVSLLTQEGALTISEVARSLGIKYNTARMRCRRAEDGGAVTRTRDGKVVCV